MKRDEANAAHFFQLGCEIGNAASCLHFANMLEWGRGVARDYPAARALYAARCVEPSDSGCAGVKRIDEFSETASKADGCVDARVDGNSDGPKGLDKQVIGRVIHLHSGEVRYCYERSLAVDHLEAGKVAVHFVIGPLGTVLSATAFEDTMTSREVQQCILQQVSSWRFPCPLQGGTVEVTFPWFFVSKEE